MIIYNVTINVDNEVQEDWLAWMKAIHIPDVMRTGMFTDFSLSKLLTRQHDETGTTYVIQYFATDMAHYDRYVEEFATGLKNETERKFGGKYVAFRTLMEKA